MHRNGTVAFKANVGGVDCNTIPSVTNWRPKLETCQRRDQWCHRDPGVCEFLIGEGTNVPSLGEAHRQHEGWGRNVWLVQAHERRIPQRARTAIALPLISMRFMGIVPAVASGLIGPKPTRLTRLILVKWLLPVKCSRRETFGAAVGHRHRERNETVTG
jgi:hypothetical protein